MEMIRCKRNVFAKIMHDYIEKSPGILLFKSGHFYTAYKDNESDWVTMDEEGAEHVIATGVDQLSDDPWFAYHFDLL
jgi:hypothetical protein